MLTKDHRKLVPVAFLICFLLPSPTPSLPSKAVLALIFTTLKAAKFLVRVFNPIKTTRQDSIDSTFIFGVHRVYIILMLTLNLVLFSNPGTRHSISASV